MTIKLCADCKHFEPAKPGYETCGAPQQPMKVSGSFFVSGIEPKMERRWKYCSVQRESESSIACGSQARWFEPREPQPLADEEPPDQYNRKLDDQHLGDEEPFRPKRDLDQMADDPRRGQAVEINKRR